MRQDLIASAVFIVFSLGVLALAAGLHGDARFFPGLVALVMLACSVLLAIRTVRKKAPAPDAPDEDDRGLDSSEATVVIASVVFVALVPVLGFILASILFIVAVSYFMNYRNLVVLIASAVIFTVAIHYVFNQVFRAPLPRGMLLGALLG